jgi:hypothetical protein
LETDAAKVATFGEHVWPKIGPIATALKPSTLTSTSTRVPRRGNLGKMIFLASQWDLPVLGWHTFSAGAFFNDA